jgi:hypothetical protein
MNVLKDLGPRGVLAAAILTAIAIAPPALLAGNPPPKPAAPAVPAEPPTINGSMNSSFEGFRWGMSHNDVAKVHNQTGGIFDNDYNPLLAKMQPGVKMQALEAEREAKKAAFAATWVEFKDTPTGYDQTGIKDEYTYRNKESIMYVDRQGRRRYFFFIADKLWKIYDEIPLGDSGPMGKTFSDVVSKLTQQFGVAGRVQPANPAQGRTQTVVDWQDGATHLRAIDRGPATIGLVYEDRATLANIAQLRANKEEDPLAMDPSIAAATRGQGRVDPNAARTPDAGKAGAGKGK